MADISQVKLPNGDTYNLVDETSGYKKFHIVPLDWQRNGTDEAGSYSIWTSHNSTDTHSQIASYINNGDVVVLDKFSNDWCHLNYYSDEVKTLEFIYITNTLYCQITRPEVSLGNTYWKTYSCELLTIDRLPIYDGTVE